jgi:hypothetical protein
MPVARDVANTRSVSDWSGTTDLPCSGLVTAFCSKAKVQRRTLGQEERNGDYRERNHYGYSDHPPGHA